MAVKKSKAVAGAGEAPAASWAGRVIQAVREPGHVSISLDMGAEDVERLALARGCRLAIEIDGRAYEAYYHGWMHGWADLVRYFGQEADEAIGRQFGIEAYLHGTKVMGGGPKVPGHDQWLVIRTSQHHEKEDAPLFDAPVGAAATVRVVERPAPPARVLMAKLKDGALAATVLASHRHGMTLNVDLPTLRKLGCDPEGWFTLTVEGRSYPIIFRRRLSMEREQEVWATPHAWVFEYRSHWDFESKTILFLTPMQFNWKGKFPDWQSYELPTVPASTVATLRPGLPQ